MSLFKRTDPFTLLGSTSFDLRWGEREALMGLELFWLERVVGLLEKYFGKDDLWCLSLKGDVFLMNTFMLMLFAYTFYCFTCWLKIKVPDVSCYLWEGWRWESESSSESEAIHLTRFENTICFFGLGLNLFKYLDFLKIDSSSSSSSSWAACFIF